LRVARGVTAPCAARYFTPRARISQKQFVPELLARAFVPPASGASAFPVIGKDVA
jgi:hypothetical protein